MPDPPIESPRVQKVARRPEGEPLLPYAELHCKTNFSFLEGASHPDELVARAVELNYAAIAITDRNSLAGVVRAHAIAKESGLKLIVGAEITLEDAPSILLFAPDRQAYAQLSRLITVGRRQAPKGECKLTFEDLAQHSQGLLAAVLPEREQTVSPESYHRYRELFSDRSYLLAELHYGVHDARRIRQLQQLSKQTGLPLVAAGDVHYHVRRRMTMQHVLTAIRHRTSVSELGERLLPNAERHLRDLKEIQSVFASLPEALQRTMEITDRCTFSLDELRYEYPEELSPPGETPIQYLRRLAWQGAEQRYASDVPQAVQKQLSYELEIIEELRYEAFFLTVYDIMQFARNQEPPILCQGRGSAANSSVCYCLGITAVDPVETELLFERFVSREREEAPDIDVDFEHERREEVLQYVYRKYGRDRAGLAATVITYRLRSAVRDVGKALGLTLDRVDTLAKTVNYRDEGTLLAERVRQSGIDPNSSIGQQLLSHVNELLGFPRHLSQHVGGMVITQGSLCELVPIEQAAMADRTVIQWNKDDLDELGVLKVDCLALGMLTAIHKCFDLIGELPEAGTSERYRPAGASCWRHPLLVEVNDVPGADPDVYEMISRAETIGVFQIESRAQMSMLPRLRPTKFYDLVIEVAIVRPGPIQGNMVHPYLQRRDRDKAGEELEPICEDERVNAVLKRTLGVPLFQEQAMQLAVEAAGFTPGEADRLRKAMGGWRRPGLIQDFRQRLIDGMLQRGHSEEFAERLFKQINGFGEYGFPESHAASFAKLAYVSAWLRYHYQAAFTASLINSQPMGFYAPAQLIQDALSRQDIALDVRPVDVNYSQWDCTLEEDGQALRLGMRLVRSLTKSAADRILHARSAPFSSARDLMVRAELSRSDVEHLAFADAFGSLALDRRKALWQAFDHAAATEDLPLFADFEEAESELPDFVQLSEQQEVFADYASTGLSLRKHPLSFYREELDRLEVTTAQELQACANDSLVRVAGLVLVRQRPGTAKKITFVTLEDETGIVNLVVHKKTWDRYDTVARRAAALVAYGRLERKNEVTHIIVQHLNDLHRQLETLRQKSRDFH